MNKVMDDPENGVGVHVGENQQLENELFRVQK